MDNNIFDNIYEAWNFIKQEEIKALKADVRLHQPPMVLKCDPTSPFPMPLSYDSIDYPLNGYFNDAPSSKFIMTRLSSGRYSLKPNLCRKKFIYRGQTKFYDPCLSNLNRKDHYYVEENMLRDEMFLLMLSHPLVQLLDQGIVIGGKKVAFEMNLYGLAQHYYNKTSLLDLTTSQDVASFFATCRYNPDDDSYTPIKEDGAVGVLYYYDLNVEQDFKPLQMTLDHQVTTIGLQVFPRSGRQYGILCNMQRMGNFNDLSQVKYVRFHQRADISQKICNDFEDGKKLFPIDILATHWKREYIGKKTLSLQALRLNQHNNKAKTIQELKAIMVEKDYVFEEHQPSFTPEELTSYYDEIRDGYWEQFCQQIHIPGDKDGSMMRELLNIPERPEYAWAFKPGIQHTLSFQEGHLLKEYAPFLQLPK